MPSIEERKLRERYEARLARDVERLLSGALASGGKGGCRKGTGAGAGEGGGGDGNAEPGWKAVRRMLLRLADELAAKKDSTAGATNL